MLRNVSFILFSIEVFQVSFFSDLLDPDVWDFQSINGLIIDSVEQRIYRLELNLSALAIALLKKEASTVSSITFDSISSMIVFPTVSVHSILFQVQLVRFFLLRKSATVPLLCVLQFEISRFSNIVHVVHAT